MKIELHLLQSFPPANLNRDDTGAPKDAEFGGHRRARISSQSLKRAIRASPVFGQIVSGRVGLRTKRAAPYVTRRLAEDHGLDVDPARTLAGGAISALLESGLNESDYTSVLVYAARPELAELARRLAESEAARDATALLVAARAALPTEDGAKPTKDQQKAVTDAEADLKKALAPVVKAFTKDHSGKTPAADIALFGRFLAEAPALKIDAACQVAHALSVDRVAPSYDYFTAVEDAKDPHLTQATDFFAAADALGDETEEDAGAAMIGTTGFNAACHYRYAVVDFDQLMRNLDGDHDAACAALQGFLTAAVTALPTGKQNSFAAQVRPEFVMTVVRRGGMPLSLVNAFATPARAGEHSVFYDAVKKLNAHWVQMEAMYDGLLPDVPAPEVFVSTPHAEGLGGNSERALAKHHVGSVREVIEGVMRAAGCGAEG